MIDGYFVLLEEIKSLLCDAYTETHNGKYYNKRLKESIDKLRADLYTTKRDNAMTIEEFNKKRPILKIVDDIDAILRELNPNEGIGNYRKSIGAVIRYSFASHPMTYTTDDPILIDRFKQLLLERKKELINEFEK